jgi:hypothetical protein
MHHDIRMLHEEVVALRAEIRDARAARGEGEG